MDAQITDSRFYMWRTLFALAHADNFLALEEQDRLSGYLDALPFSKEQLGILREDMATPQDGAQMFAKVTAAEDRAAFFKLAHELVLADGTVSPLEQELLQRLEAVYPQDGEGGGFFKDLIGKIINKGERA